MDDTIIHLDERSQQPPSTDQKPSSYDSVTEEEPEQLQSIEKPVQAVNNKVISHQEGNTEEQRGKNQDSEQVEKSTQEDQETTKNQKVEFDWHQKMEENKKFQKDLDVIIRRLDQVSQQPPFVENEEKPKKFNQNERQDQTFFNQTNQNSIKEKTELMKEGEEKDNSKQPEETIIQEEAVHQKLKSGKETNDIT
ncbi:MAG: hypothetical protein ACFE9L_14645 [Candidatus Hodarchaeota archaeon]